MTEKEAIEIVLTALGKKEISVGKRKMYALPGGRNMRLGKDRTGWIVYIPLDVPETFEPNEAHVEVYEPDGELNFPSVI